MPNLLIPARYTILNLFLFLKNLLLYPFSRPARHRLSHGYDALSYPFYGENHVELSNLLRNDDLEVSLSPLKAREHNTTEFELVSIAALIKDRQANSVFEIGTFDGRTTRAMAKNLLNEEGRIYTLNLPPTTENVNLQTGQTDIDLASKVVSGERFLNTSQEKYIQQLWGDSATFDFSPYFNIIDVVFIDGAHSEPYVKSDTENSLKLIKATGGIIIWHDAHLFGVKDFFTKCIARNEYPVYFIRNTSLAVMGVRNGQPFDISQ